MQTAAHLFIADQCYLVSDSVSGSSRMGFTSFTGIEGQRFPDIFS